MLPLRVFNEKIGATYCMKFFNGVEEAYDMVGNSFVEVTDSFDEFVCYVGDPPPSEPTYLLSRLMHACSPCR